MPKENLPMADELRRGRLRNAKMNEYHHKQQQKKISIDAQSTCKLDNKTTTRRIRPTTTSYNFARNSSNSKITTTKQQQQHQMMLMLSNISQQRRQNVGAPTLLSVRAARLLISNSMIITATSTLIILSTLAHLSHESSSSSSGAAGATASLAQAPVSLPLQQSSQQQLQSSQQQPSVVSLAQIDIVTSVHSKPNALEYEYYVMPGSSFKLECSVPLEGKNSYVWLRTPLATSIGHHHHFSNGNGAGSGGGGMGMGGGGHKSQIISIKSEFREGFQNIEPHFNERTGQYDLFIQNATYDLHEGHYTCDYSPSFTRTYQVIVVSAPDMPIMSGTGIDLTTLPPAREGVEYQLNCSSSKGNPDPKLTWYKNDIPLEGKLIPSGNPFERPTVNMLTIMPRMEDHRAVFKCKVSGKALEMYAQREPSKYQNGYETEQQLLVEYAPRISVGPAQPLRVIQGHDAQLECHVNANPPVRNIKWFKEKKFLSSSYNYTLKNVSKLDTNQYYCEADNGVAAPGSGSSSLSPSAASSLLLTGGRLQQSSAAQQSFFDMFGSLLSSSSSSSSDISSDLSPLINGDQQQQHQLSASAVRMPLNVIVLYPPSVIVKTDLNEYNEGDTITLDCLVDSSPAPYKIVWTRLTADGGQVLDSYENLRQIKLQQVTANMAGQYECRVFVRMEPSTGGVVISTVTQASGAPAATSPGEHEATGRVQVHINHRPGQAELIIAGSGATSSGNYATMAASGNSSNSYSSVPIIGTTELGRQTQLLCRAKPPGWPQPSYVIQKRYANSMKKNLQISASQNHTIVSTKLDDEGHYVCQATNKYGQSSEAQVELIVNEAPTIVIAPIHSDQRQVGERYFITLRARAKPKPKVTWYHMNSDTGNFTEITSTGGRSMLSAYADYATTNNAGEAGSLGAGNYLMAAGGDQVSPLTLATSSTQNNGQNFQQMASSSMTTNHLHHLHQSSQFDQLTPSSYVSESGRFKVETKYNLLESPKNKDPLLKPQFEIQTTLTFDSLTLDNRGKYQIVFDNGQSRKAVATSELHIEHAPLFKHQFDRQAFDVNETVNLTCLVSAYPRPEFYWTNKDGQALEQSTRYKHRVVPLDNDLWQSNLTFEKAQEEDYLTNYTCHVRNRLNSNSQQQHQHQHQQQANDNNNNNQQQQQALDGDLSGAGTSAGQQQQNSNDEVRAVFRLVRKSAPEAPTHLEVVEFTSDSVILQWVPGFNGGFLDTNYLVLARNIMSSSTAASASASAASLVNSNFNYDNSRAAYHQQQQQQQPQMRQNNQLLDPINGADNSNNNNNNNNIGQNDEPFSEFDCQRSNPCGINSLMPRQTYVIKVKAANIMGESAYSNEVTITTRANSSQIPRVLEATFDSSMNKVVFTIEPGLADYLNLSAKVDVRYTLLSASSNTPAQPLTTSPNGPIINGQQQQMQQVGGSGMMISATTANDQPLIMMENQQQLSNSIGPVAVSGAAAASSSLSLNSNNNNNKQLVDSQARQQQQQQQQQQTINEWSFLTRVPIVKETQELFVSPPVQPVSEMRIAICVGGANQQQPLSGMAGSAMEPCGPDFPIRMQDSISGSMWKDGRVLSMPFLLSIVFVIIVVASMATFLHSTCQRCVTSKAKQHMMASDKSIITTHHNGNGNASINGHQLGHNAAAPPLDHLHQHADSDTGCNGVGGGGGVNGGQKSNTTSTTSTNLIGGQTPLEQSSNTGSEHSSDHSRQVKLDSMSPPNYNNWAANHQQQHNADMALMSAHHHHQHQLQHQHNAMGGPEKALIDHLNTTANNHYGIHHLQQQQQQDAHQMLANQAQQQQQQQLLHQHQATQQQYQQATGGNYNLANMLDPMSLDATGAHNSLSGPNQSDMWLLQSQQQQQQQQQQHKLQDQDLHSYATSLHTNGSAYGYTSANIVPDPMLSPGQLPDPIVNGHNSQYQSFYYPAPHPQDPLLRAHQQQQYQHELAIQQQALYGTLTRGGPIYSQYAPEHAQAASYMSPGQQQQQQHNSQDSMDIMQQSVYNDYGSSTVPPTTATTTAAAAAAAAAAALSSVQQPLGAGTAALGANGQDSSNNNNISDYGTTSGIRASGGTAQTGTGSARLIREIIV